MNQWGLAQILGIRSDLRRTLGLSSAGRSFSTQRTMTTNRPASRHQESIPATLQRARFNSQSWQPLQSHLSQKPNFALLQAEDEALTQVILKANLWGQKDKGELRRHCIDIPQAVYFKRCHASEDPVTVLSFMLKASTYFVPKGDCEQERQWRPKHIALSTKKEKMFRRRQSDEEARAITDKIGEFPFWEEPFEDRTPGNYKNQAVQPMEVEAGTQEAI